MGLAVVKPRRDGQLEPDLASLDGQASFLSDAGGLTKFGETE